MKRTFVILSISITLLFLSACSADNSETLERVNDILTEYNQVKSRTDELFTLLAKHMYQPDLEVSLDEGYPSSVNVAVREFLDYLKLFYEDSITSEQFNKVVTQYLFLDDSANGFEWFVHFTPENGNPRFLIIYFEGGGVVDVKTFGSSR